MTGIRDKRAQHADAIKTRSTPTPRIDPKDARAVREMKQERVKTRREQMHVQNPIEPMTPTEPVLDLDRQPEPPESEGDPS
ncbi:hypothetical protein GCM10010988_05780 [Cnuibacter physcomitrellae]|uniref:Uncharacterized protein n=1 Tax=Cnuibacter physcomitrellae TaxID=1619308 RepID=A0A1X9LQS8_9MICO|nr:hypothetical protein [Cnuibacter physcomitrellae]ARJ05489.1 hypothetical protein B5808_09825 [Cnuibacter physcomitrellae]GGI35803.1 hypothetical protein GCM10010988_05780 [Cnuibacter physcomitrellae]